MSCSSRCNFYFGFSPGIGFLPGSVLTILLTYRLFYYLHYPGRFVSPFHHCPLLVLGNRREFSLSSGSCKGSGFCEPLTFCSNRLCIQPQTVAKLHIDQNSEPSVRRYLLSLTAFGSVISSFFFRSSCSISRVTKRVIPTHGLFCCVLSRRGFFLSPPVELFVVLVDSTFCSPFRVLRLLPSFFLFCTTNSRFPLPPPLSCLLCDHACMVLWCLYLVSHFLPCTHIPFA